MFNFSALYTISLFLLMVIFLIWRPRGINESIPPSIAALLILFAGIVPLNDIFKILGIVGGASITILSTIVMSIVLDSIGFFRWAAFNLVNRANGSGTALFWYINLLCFLMTMFFNNDGSILITTPIIINIVTMLKLKHNQQFPYLLSGALIATASSAPIAVSNLANLIALKIVGLDLNSYVTMMFVPSVLGIVSISLVLFYYFHKHIPKTISVFPAPNLGENNFKSFSSIRRSTLADKTNHLADIDMSMFTVCIGIVTLIRAGLFVGTSFGIPMEWIGFSGALLLIGVRWFRKGIGAYDIVKKTPWHIVLFAFSIYVVVYALQNIGLTTSLVKSLRAPMLASYFNASLISGGLLTLMSNLFNNLPSVMIGTFTLTSMGLDTSTLQIAYLSSIIGSDIGSLITPMGTLASLIWMFLLRKNGITVKWADYLKVSIVVIPIGFIISLLSLNIWVKLLFF